jgi:hypothetical protein
MSTADSFRSDFEAGLEGRNAVANVLPAIIHLVRDLIKLILTWIDLR